MPHRTQAFRKLYPLFLLRWDVHESSEVQKDGIPENMDNE